MQRVCWGGTATAAFSQSADDHSKMEKMSTEKKAAMKMGGHDASKMSAQDKSDLFDKMSEDKRMKLMMGHGMMIQTKTVEGPYSRPALEFQVSYYPRQLLQLSGAGVLEEVGGHRSAQARTMPVCAVS